jgi:hypothetical protein
MQFSSLRHFMVFKSRKIKNSIFVQRMLMQKKLWLKEMSKKKKKKLRHAL